MPLALGRALGGRYAPLCEGGGGSIGLRCLAFMAQRESLCRSRVHLPEGVGPPPAPMVSSWRPSGCSRCEASGGSLGGPLFLGGGMGMGSLLLQSRCCPREFFGRRRRVVNISGGAERVNRAPGNWKERGRGEVWGSMDRAVDLSAAEGWKISLGGSQWPIFCALNTRQMVHFLEPCDPRGGGGGRLLGFGRQLPPPPQLTVRRRPLGGGGGVGVGVLGPVESPPPARARDTLIPKRLFSIFFRIFWGGMTFAPPGGGGGGGMIFGAPSVEPCFFWGGGRGGQALRTACPRTLNPRAPPGAVWQPSGRLFH